MELQYVLKRFKEIYPNEKVVSYEDKGDKIILVTQVPKGMMRTGMYVATKDNIQHTFPFECGIDFSKLKKV